MAILRIYKIIDNHISEMSRASPPVEGWEAFPISLDYSGPCFGITKDLEVDLVEHRARFIAPDMFGQTLPDPGTPPDVSTVLLTVAACQAWVSTAEGTPAYEGYRHALWVHEQLTKTTPRAGIKSALGIG